MTHRASERRKPSKYLHTNKNPPSGLSGRRVGFFFFCCLLPHSRQRQEQDEHGAANVQRRVFVYSSDGGAEGNRTPVRKPVFTTFSECSLSFGNSLAAAPTNRLYGLVSFDTLQVTRLLTGSVHHWSTPFQARGPSRNDGSALRQLLKRDCRLRLNLGCDD